MGQQLSGQAVMNHLPEKLVKHIRLVRDSGYLTYEEFLARVAELNEVTAKLAAGQKKHLLFEVQPGSDATALWKVAVRVLCTKAIALGQTHKQGIYEMEKHLQANTAINKENGMMEASRIMNLYQFTQLYRDVTSQAAEVLSAEGATEGPAPGLPSTDSCQASMWMGRVKELTDEEECCICMDGKADLILPCAHSFCQKCIDKWSGQNRNCPICRLQVTAAKESWVLSDFPTQDDMAGYILNFADDAGYPHRP